MPHKIPRAPDYFAEGNLPERVRLPRVLEKGEAPRFELKAAWPHPSRRTRLIQGMYLGGFFIGITALVLFAFNVYSRQVDVGSEEFANLLQVNEYAYVAAAAGLAMFRFGRTPPSSMEVRDDGIEFGFENGRREFVAWSEAESETGVFDLDRGTERVTGRWIFVTLPGFAFFRTLAFMRPRVPRTHLTHDAADAVLAGAVRAGLTVTRYGNRYVMDRLNPMEFHPNMIH